ncbi:MAG: response regulator transcription factor [Gammaproteobacteria bacterium]
MPGLKRAGLRTIAIYGAAIAAGAFVLQWLEYRHATRFFSTEFYVVVVAMVFTLTGAFVGHRLTRTTRAAKTFERNQAALDTLGLSLREVEVLDLLADGHTNQKIADKLHVSENTIKTHLKNIYAKLDVSRRTQAIKKARDLRLLP